QTGQSQVGPTNGIPARDRASRATYNLAMASLRSGLRPSCLCVAVSVLLLPTASLAQSSTWELTQPEHQELGSSASLSTEPSLPDSGFEWGIGVGFALPFG